MHKHLAKIIHKGENIDCEEGFTVFYGHENIYLGSNIFLVDTLINAGDAEGKVIIEDYVFFGHGVKILARGHDYTLYNDQRQQSVTQKPIHIKKGAWIASGSIVLGGVTVGENSVIAAGSVVTKDVPPNTIVAGNPAKFVKFINKKQTFIEKLKRIKIVW